MPFVWSCPTSMLTWIQDEPRPRRTVALSIVQQLRSHRDSASRTDFAIQEGRIQTHDRSRHIAVRIGIHQNYWQPIWWSLKSYLVQREAVLSSSSREGHHLDSVRLDLKSARRRGRFEASHLSRASSSKLISAAIQPWRAAKCRQLIPDLGLMRQVHWSRPGI